MLEKKVLDLLNQELDGVNSEKERAAVRRVLQKKPEARKYFEDLQEISLVLRRVKDVPAPAHLKGRILNALPFPKQTAAVRVIPARSFLQDLRSNLRIRYAYTFAGGALAGILLFALFTGQPSDTSNLTGTMASNQPAVVAESKANINLAEVTGTVNARRFASTVVADFDLNVPQEVDVIVNFNQQHVQFDSFRSVSNSQGTLVVLEEQLRLTVSGQAKYQMTFSGVPVSGAPIAVRLFARGLLLSEYELSFE